MEKLSQEKIFELVATARPATDTAPAKEAGKAEKFTGAKVGTVAHAILSDMPAAMKELDYLRLGDDKQKALDVTLAQFAREKWGFAPDANGKPSSLLSALGVDTSMQSVEKLYTMPEFNDGYRWLVPEIFRDAIRTGLRKNPIYPNLIASEETVSQMQVTMPEINMSEAVMKKMNEAASVGYGTASFSQKTVKLNKYGIGFNITDEVMMYASIDLLSIMLQDMGVQMGLALDSQAFDVLINGDGSSNSAAKVIGVATSGTLAYKDILKLWLRMGRLGKLPNAICAGEDMAINMLELQEFKGFSGQSTTQQIVVRTPIPSSQNVYVHGAVTSNDQMLFVDSTAALIKLNAQPLRLESERIVSKQINGTVATMTTGFATLFNDARVILDKSLAYSSNPFPAELDPTATERTSFK